MPNVLNSEVSDAVDIINAIHGLGLVSSVTGGFTEAQIITSYNNLTSPTLSDAQIVDLLDRMAKDGIVNVVCSAATTVDEASCLDSPDTARLFSVNQNMLARNNANARIVLAINPDFDHGGSRESSHEGSAGGTFACNIASSV